MIYDDHSYCAGGHCTECWCFTVWVNDPPGVTCGLDHAPVDIPADEDYDEPCQPIGCDNGYHLPGCKWEGNS